ncbi:hypothetical protein TRFO_05780 [Tritrichomonas foetus]|uniref:Protein kinase domain-containing protein n=1 Tax=Tritrichomonas foetus TaxID=1144522 RepID=A0A1J4K2J5_9EUKA|nr:hypothetical protein TRFO_05780 [Tritrichomonas foetus]|eukprot:OHT05665.1 hypothetical protein TRFO_05780 [Tritrichomonas foetus]
MMDKQEWYVIQKLNAFVIETGISAKLSKGYINATDQKVVFKGVDMNDISSLKNEAEKYAEYHHFALQSIIGYYEARDVRFSLLITPFMDNLSLDKFISQKNKEDNIVIKLLQICGICSAMEYLEQKSMTHRDLNPSNILIDKDFHPHVKGFGIQKKFTIEEMQENKHIQIQYFAPEIVKGEEYTIKSDVYSFGIIMNQMFTEKIPYSECSSRNEILQKISHYEKPELSSTIPPFLKKLINKCLSDDPVKRLTFRKLLKKLKLKLDRIPGDISLIHGYLNKIKMYNTYPNTFFRIPVQLTKRWQEIEKIGKSSPNSQEVQNFYPINLNKFAGVLSKAQGRPIHLIMVFGFYQAGKSTFLRTLTGNGAFYSGDNSKSTTMGILIDGPYSIDSLIKRIREPTLRDLCNDSKIKLEDDPAIFFLDSQGIGDENYIKYHHFLMERIHSIFCTISDIVINVTTMNEPITASKQIIESIRRGQMIRKNEDITRVFYLVRDIPQEILSITFDGQMSSFEKAQAKLQKKWMKQHLIVQFEYSENCYTTLPIGDFRNNAPSYLSTVWYSFLNMIKALKQSGQKYVNDILEYTSLMAITLFSPFFSKFSAFMNDSMIKKDSFQNFSSAQQHCYCLGLLVLDEIVESIKRGQKDGQKVEKIFKELLFAINCYSDVFLPYLLGADNVSFLDFTQYSYEIKKDIDAFLKINYEDFRRIATKKKTSLIKYIGGAIGTAAFIGAATLGAAVAVPAAAIAAPIAGLASFAVGGGSYLGWMTVSVINDKRIDEIMSRTINLSIPYLWNRNIIDNCKLKKNIDINGILKISNWKNIELLIAYEQPSQNTVSIYIQSLTGIKMDSSNTGKINLLLGPFNPQDLAKRLSRCYPIHESGIKKNLYILYLKGFTSNEFTQIDSVQQIARCFITSDSHVRGELILMPTVLGPTIHFFHVVQSLPIKVIKKKDYLNYQSTIMKTQQSEFSSPMIFKWSIIMDDSISITQQGPRTNETLRYALRVILDDPKMVIKSE